MAIPSMLYLLESEFLLTNSPKEMEMEMDKQSTHRKTQQPNREDRIQKFSCSIFVIFHSRNILSVCSCFYTWISLGTHSNTIIYIFHLEISISKPSLLVSPAWINLKHVCGQSSPGGKWVVLGKLRG